MEKGYFLGKTSSGFSVYMPKPSWDCGWYWGFGYLYHYQGKTNRSYSAVAMQHFETFGENTNLYDGFKSHIVETPLTDRQIWTLCDYMKTFYTLRKTAQLFHLGNSNYTSVEVNIKNDDLYNKINKELLPQIFNAIDLIFQDNNKNMSKDLMRATSSHKNA